jgi:heme/copper-type cytochrome/quinol oxidase subunit 1
MKNKVPVVEVLIVLAVLMVTLLLAFFVKGVIMGNTTLDIPLHNTYFVLKFSWQMFVLLPFLILISLIYAVRGTMDRFKNSRQNFILLISTFLLNVLLLWYFKLIGKITIHPSRWTVYPPLPGIKDNNAQPSLFTHIEQILFISQIILMLLLVIIAVLTGKNWKTNNDHIKAQ